MEIKKIKSALERKDFFSIVAMKMELGYKIRTKAELTSLEDIIEYLSYSSKHCVEILFDTDDEDKKRTMYHPYFEEVLEVYEIY